MIMSIRQEREHFIGQIKEEMAEYPVPPPLDMQILDKHYRSDRDHVYEEWKIDYRVETEEAMPQLPGRSVPAYLLVPKDERFSPPYPAMVAFHQCNTDCIIAKDAVVGKAVQRPDQAYGYELVIQGFVVLAPDAINCGERNIPSIRRPYENNHCHQILSEPLGRPFWFKHAYDGMRAVDVLSGTGLCGFGVHRRDRSLDGIGAGCQYDGSRSARQGGSCNGAGHKKESIWQLHRAI